MNDISIHALLAESDRRPLRNGHHPPRFLSTLSLRRATSKLAKTSRTEVISIHALLAESDAWSASKLGGISISIHALLAESDHNPRSRKQPHQNFYPRSPCGERLAYPDMIICTNVISIHALLAESDRNIANSER